MKCLVCKQRIERITTDGWEPFCSEICRDSAEAEFQREIESEGAEFSPEEERRVMSARFASATYAGVLCYPVSPLPEIDDDELD
jgi:endogenous inhibitor of DNA gyrase (YacG/DUF329 family)